MEPAQQDPQAFADGLGVSMGALRKMVNDGEVDVGKMIAALERLRQLHEPSQLPSQMAAFGINGGLGQGLRKLLTTHPPLEERIAALRQASE